MRSFLQGSLSVCAIFGLGLCASACGGEADPGELAGAAAPGDVESGQDALLTPAADASGMGPLATTFGDYHLPPQTYVDVQSDRQTELWARVYRPTSLVNGPYPVLLVMPGNGFTCGTSSYFDNPNSDCNYTTTGTCVAPNPVVIQHHLGFEYLAKQLASWGFVTVAINTNLGITCGTGVVGDTGLILSRGRMYMKHLETLYGWATAQGTTPASVGVDLFGLLDFSQIGFIGHSRGAQGARAAVQAYRDVGSIWPARIPNAGFKGIFEIAGNDGFVPMNLDALGMAWHQLQPACDASNLIQPGFKPFDRMINAASDGPTASKSYSLAWGMNHTMFNANSKLSESLGCANTYWTEPALFPQTGDSPPERTLAKELVGAFFRGTFQTNVLGEYDPTLMNTFDPAFGLPGAVKSITNVNRGYIPSGNPSVMLPLDDFNSQGQSTWNGVNVLYGSVLNADPSLKAARVTWSAAGSTRYFQSAWAAAGSGTNLGNDASVSFRIARVADPANLKNVPTDLSIQLVDSTGALSNAVLLSTYTTLGGPTGTLYSSGGGQAMYYHNTLRTVVLPLCDFSGVNKSAIRGMRFTFSATASGSIYITNIRRKLGGAVGCIPTPPVLPGQQSPGIDSAMPDPTAWAPEPAPSEVVLAEGNALVDVRWVASADAALGRGLDVTLRSERPFSPAQDLLALEVGGELVTLSRYPDPRDLRTVTFTLTAEQAARLRGGEALSVRLGGEGPSPLRWAFGALPATL